MKRRDWKIDLGPAMVAARETHMLSARMGAPFVGESLVFPAEVADNFAIDGVLIGDRSQPAPEGLSYPFNLNALGERLRKLPNHYLQVMWPLERCGSGETLSLMVRATRRGGVHRFIADWFGHLETA